MDKDEKYDPHKEGIKFLCHRIARVCKTERQFDILMITANIYPGTEEYEEAKRVWLRLRAKKDNPLNSLSRRARSSAGIFFHADSMILLKLLTNSFSALST